MEESELKLELAKFLKYVDDVHIDRWGQMEFSSSERGYQDVVEQYFLQEK